MSATAANASPASEGSTHGLELDWNAADPGRSPAPHPHRPVPWPHGRPRQGLRPGQPRYRAGGLRRRVRPVLPAKPQALSAARDVRAGRSLACRSLARISIFEPISRATACFATASSTATFGASAISGGTTSSRSPSAAPSRSRSPWSTPGSRIRHWEDGSVCPMYPHRHRVCAGRTVPWPDGRVDAALHARPTRSRRCRSRAAIRGCMARRSISACRSASGSRMSRARGRATIRTSPRVRAASLLGLRGDPSGSGALRPPADRDHPYPGPHAGYRRAQRIARGRLKRGTEARADGSENEPEPRPWPDGPG